MVKMNGFAATRNARQLRYVADKVGKAQKCLRSFYNTRKQCLCIYTQAKTPFSLPSNIPNPLTISPQSMNLIAWKYGCALFRRFLIFTRKGTDGFFSVCAFESYALLFVRHVFTVTL